MPSMVRPKMRQLFPSAWVVRALLHSGRRYHCERCNEPMFVRYASGLCPWCFIGRPLSGREIAEESPQPVAEHLALAGVLDDPAIEA